eukprot:PhM_4_TR17460/c0_g1_i3/m.85768
MKSFMRSISAEPSESAYATFRDASSGKLTHGGLLEFFDLCSQKGRWMNAICALQGARHASVPFAEYGRTFEVLALCCAQSKSWWGGLYCLTLHSQATAADGIPTTKTVNHALASLVPNRRWIEGLKLFASVRRSDGRIKMDNDTYTQMQKLCSAVNDWQLGLIVYRTQKVSESSVKINDDSVCPLLRSLTAAGQWRTALTISKSLPLSTRVANELVRALGSAGCWSEAMITYTTAREFKLASPTVLHTLVNVLSDAQRFDAATSCAETLLKERAVYSSAKCDSVATLIRAKRCSGDIDGAVAALTSLQANTTSTRLVCELCEVSKITRDINLSVEFFERLPRKTPIAISAVIDMFETLGRTDDVIRMYRRFSDALDGDVPLPIELSVVATKAFGEMKLWKTALQVVETIRARASHTVTPDLLNALVLACEASGYTRPHWRWRDFP